MTRKALVYLPAVAGVPGVPPEHVERARREVPELDWVLCATEAEFVEGLADAEAAVVWSFPSRHADKGPKLRILATPAAGRDWIKITPRPDLRVMFGTFHGELMAETALGMMLAFSRGIMESIARSGEVWPREEVVAVQRPLRGGTAVILGFGHIGKWVGRLLAPFDMRLIGVNRSDMTVPDYFHPGDRVIPVSQLDGALGEADHVVIALPGGPDSDNVLDSRRLGLLRPGAYVYNIGRGNAIDIDALERALRSGAIAGAGLDVFPVEPLPAEASIRTCPGVIRMPHVSAFAPNYFDLFFDEFLPRLRGAL